MACPLGFRRIPSRIDHSYFGQKISDVRHHAGLPSVHPQFRLNESQLNWSNWQKHPDAFQDAQICELSALAFAAVKPLTEQVSDCGCAECGIDFSEEGDGKSTERRLGAADIFAIKMGRVCRLPSSGSLVCNPEQIDGQVRPESEIEHLGAKGL